MFTLSRLIGSPHSCRVHAYTALCYVVTCVLAILEFFSFFFLIDTRFTTVLQFVTHGYNTHATQMNNKMINFALNLRLYFVPPPQGSLDFEILGERRTRTSHG